MPGGRWQFPDAEQSQSRNLPPFHGAFPGDRKLYPVSEAFLGTGDSGTAGSGVDLGLGMDMTARSPSNRHVSNLF